MILGVPPPAWDDWPRAHGRRVSAAWRNMVECWSAREKKEEEERRRGVREERERFFWGHPEAMMHLFDDALSIPLNLSLGPYFAINILTGNL